MTRRAVRIRRALALISTFRHHDPSGSLADIHDALVGRHTGRTHDGAAEIRDELDQSMAWWDRQYNDLVDATFESEPFDIAEHDGHPLFDASTYADPAVVLRCGLCPPPRLVPRAPTSPSDTPSDSS